MTEDVVAHEQDVWRRGQAVCGATWVQAPEGAPKCEWCAFEQRDRGKGEKARWADEQGQPNGNGGFR